MKRIPALTFALLLLLTSCGSTVEVEETTAKIASPSSAADRCMNRASRGHRIR